MPPSTNWTSFAESPYPWERDALDFVRNNLPTHEPFRAWSLFEFIALDGSVNEVDLLVYAPYGFFLIEIKSHPGKITGDGGTWLWESKDGRRTSLDNPLKLANLKAKRLAGLLAAQSSARRGKRIPFIEPLIFLSSPELTCSFSGTGGLKVCLRDTDSRPGIMAAIRQRNCPGLESLTGRPTLDRPTAKTVVRAIEEAGIRQSNRQRRVSDYILDEQIDEGSVYQDWRAHHASLSDVTRRIRIYPQQTAATPDARQRHQRAAIREYQLQESLQHDRVLRALQYTDHELGPAIIFEHDPTALRLDHFLAERDSELTLSTRLDLVRQLAEVMQFAHEKRVVHRSLSPRSVLVSTADAGRPRLKVFNWQAGYRAAADRPGAPQGITATSHVGQLVDDPTTAYIAPDVFTADGESLGEHLDVFSLGAVAYHILSGQPPAADGADLATILRQSRGLQLASVVDAASSSLCDLIRYATHPDVSTRHDSVADFLTYLDLAEEELTAPESEEIDTPADAQAGDVLAGGFVVIRRLGQGSCSVAHLVSRGPGNDAELLILKAASNPEHNERVRAEAKALEDLAGHRDKRIVEFVEAVEIGESAALLMRPAFADRKTKRIETLGSQIRKQGRLQAELLQRFGEDLIGVAAFLDRLGIAHRDIKPDNIATALAGPDQALQLVLFDFSLVSTPPDNIRAGTPGYLDPLLPLRTPPPRFDNYAERYAVAATLYEMATGTLPRWGDGRSDPSQIDDEITIDPDLFDPGVREPLTDFFRRCFRRALSERHDNAEQMLAEWQACFADVQPPLTTIHRESDIALGDPDDEPPLSDQLASATLATPLAELGMGTRATNALDRANVLSVRDLLAFNGRRLERMPGVGAKTRREIVSVMKHLRERLAPHGLPPAPDAAAAKPKPTAPATEPAPPAAPESLSLDAIAASLTAPMLSRSKGDSLPKLIDHLFGRAASSAEPAAAASPWPSQSAIAEAIGVTRGRVSQLFRKLLTEATKHAGLLSLHADIAAFLKAQGGVATAEEIAGVLLTGRGSDLAPAAAERLALGLVRIAAEADSLLASPALVTRREAGTILIAVSDELTDYAVRLGHTADVLIATPPDEPLPSPARVVERLRRVGPPAAAGLSDARLVRLAAAASKQAVVSSRLELYPRGMEPLRALKLSHGALAGVRELSEADLRSRVVSRYPQASPLPSRPALDDLLHAAGLPLAFDPAAARGQGGYRAPQLLRPSATTGSTLQSRLQTAQPAGPAAHVSSPEVASAQSLEARLALAVRDGSFLKMVVAPKHYDRAAAELARRFAVEPVDVEAIVLAALEATAAEKRVGWSRIVAADATKNAGNWTRLTGLLVKGCRPAIAAQLFTPGKTPLLLYADILVRYGLKNLLAELQAAIGTANGPHGAWLLVPGGTDPLLDGEPVGVPGENAVVPSAWVINAHRAALAAPSSESLA